MLDLREDIRSKVNITKIITMFLAFVIGIMAFGTNVNHVEASTLLDPIEGGYDFQSLHDKSFNGHTPTRYKHILGGNNSYGYLPDIKNLSKYGVKNLGWGLNSPARDQVSKGSANRDSGSGGREFSHSVYPSMTKFVKASNGDEYLRISGSAVLPKYFHHTQVNHEVAIVTRDNTPSKRTRLWKANLVNESSSASYDYGWGWYRNETTWRATVQQPGFSKAFPIHVTNDPYPEVVEKINRSSDAKYFNRGNKNLLNTRYDSWINERQVAKLAGLGKVGATTSGTNGNTYILDYTGFVVDIPVRALIPDGTKRTEIEFNIVMTMHTPNGREARIVGQPLGIPGVSPRNTVHIDEVGGTVGEVELRRSDLNQITYNPHNDLQRNFKKTSNFVTKEYTVNTLDNNPHAGNLMRNRTFTATRTKPRMVGIGFDLLPRFGGKANEEINSTRGKNSVDFVEMLADGRGEMWVGWQVNRITDKAKVYTTAGHAFDRIPVAKMIYTPNRNQQDHKVIQVRHIEVKNGNYRSPGKVFSTDVYSRKKGGSGITAQPLSGSNLTAYGRNARFIGRGRIGGDVTSPLLSVAQRGIQFSNSQLFSASLNGSGVLIVDLYYSDIDGTSTSTDPYGELTVRERHRPAGTSSNIAGTAVDHRVGLGQSLTVSRQRPFGYTYAGYYRVDNGSNQNRTTYSVVNTENDRSWSQWVVFYYNLRRYNYEVEHVNAETGNKIEHNISDYITSTNENSPTRRTVYPLRGNQLPDGYTYAGYYNVDGTRRNGNNYTIVYDDESNNLVVRFFYDWNEPEETTKRFQGDDTGSPRPIDTYINAGLQTERDVNGNVVNTSLQANTSAVIDTYEAPIAIIPQQTRVAFRRDNGSEPTNSRVSSSVPVTLYNNEFLETLRLDRRVGGSRDANGNQPTRVTVRGGVPMSSGSVSGTEDLQDKALGRSGATVGVNEDRDFVGRWVDSGVTDMRRWTPEGALGVLSRNLVYSNKDEVNGITEVVATYEVDVYNRIKHNYRPRVGSDGLEFYEYTGSDILQGYYQYNSSGNRVGSLRNARVRQSTTLDIDDIGVNEYVDAEGFKVGAGQVAPAQFKVASELFDDGGRTLRGYQSEALPNDGAVDPVVTKEDTAYNVNRNTGDTPRVDYYEEFGYVPFHTEDEVVTQQAIPVGGKVTYVNPYEYFLFPTVDRLSVMEESGNTVSEIRNNVNSFRLEGLFDSDVKFTPEHSGFYMSEVDEVGEFESSIPNVTEGNKNHMRANVTPVNQYNPVRPNELTTRNYRTYHNLIGGSTSRYTTVDTLQSVDNFNKKLPVTYVYGLSEFLLDDVVAVGKDTGYPVVSQAGTIGSDYVTRYTADNGVAPSESDKLVTSNNGSIYLIPIHNEGQTVDDVYNTRLFVNQIGISQFNLIDEDEITFEKYLYGRGDNVIYSGVREEVEVEGEFTQDQKVGQNAKPETTTQFNGTRTSNNKEVNDKVLDEE